MQSIKSDHAPGYMPLSNKSLPCSCVWVAWELNLFYTKSAHGDYMLEIEYNNHIYLLTNIGLVHCWGMATKIS